MTTKLLKLSDDHFTAIDIAVQQRQQLTEYCGGKRQNRCFFTFIRSFTHKTYLIIFLAQQRKIK